MGGQKAAQHFHYTTDSFPRLFTIFPTFFLHFWEICDLAKYKKVCYLIDTRKQTILPNKKREAKPMVDPNINES